MPKIKNLAALAAAVEAGRRYARSNPEKAGQYVDQAAAFVDKQTKGKYSGQIDGVVDKVKGAAGLPRSTRRGVVGGVQGYEANAGYGRHQGYGDGTPSVGTHSAGTTAPVTPSTTVPPTSPSSTTSPSATTPPLSTPPRTAPAQDQHFPGSKDI